MERYKLILSNSRVLREVELEPEAKTIHVGTGQRCHVRFAHELFFEDFYFTLENQENVWTLTCGEGNYVSADGVLKKYTQVLAHGDNLVLKYSQSNQEIINISFTLDFEYETKDYDRVIDINDLHSFTIGGIPGNDIELKDPLVKGEQIVVSHSGGKLTLRDHGTRYGVYVNGVRIAEEEAMLADYDFFSIIGYGFYFKYGKLYTQAASKISTVLPAETVRESDGRFEYPKFNRNTRVRINIPDEKIAVLDPPAEPQKPKDNIIQSLMPTLAMLVLVVVVRGQMGGGGSFVIFSALSMGVGILTSIYGFVNNKRQYKKDVARRNTVYKAYIAEKRKFIEEKRTQELAILNKVYRGPEQELELVWAFSPDLFDRTADDADFLSLRVGVGETLSNQPVSFQDKETIEISDDLLQIPPRLASEYRVLTQAPISFSGEKSNAVGIVGGRNGLIGFSRNLILDLTVRHYFGDVKLFFIAGEHYSGEYAWLRHLPHIHNEQLGVNNTVLDEESRNLLFDFLYKELSRRETDRAAFPRMVIIVMNDTALKGHPISNYIDKAHSLGVLFVLFEEHKEDLPLGCDFLILLDNSDNGIIQSCHDRTVESHFSYEPITQQDSAKFVQKMAPVFCDEISLESALTKSITFFELLNIYSVNDLDLQARWASSASYKTMAAPLGVRSNNEIVYLDLHEKAHGPHGLVAGTTGSGKSEILQSYILSMATLFGPDEVGFVIIDFKGGGMVNQFEDLPHLIGAITNIDGREIDRSLLSIKAELRKRQRLFAEHKVNHIDAYIKLFKDGTAKVAMPHLFLISDEFAELKSEHPDFMKELISAARIGRSLGVHLILATQKPSGVVDGQIWSNSKFKLCLKVQTKEDSNEVIKTPLAAEIVEPGRAYLQVGNNEIFELFQSAYSGAAIPDKSNTSKQFVIHSVNEWGKREVIYSNKKRNSDKDQENQLEATVSYIKEYCAASGVERPSGICMPPLPDTVYFRELDLQYFRKSSAFAVPVGLVDDPERQSQFACSVELAEGNTYIVGTAQTGKTTLLQTMIYGLLKFYTPAEVNIYVIDCGNMALKIFEEAKHVGGVALSVEEERIQNLFKMLLAMIAQRKEHFAAKNLGTFASYCEAGNTDLPQVFLLIDNMAVFKELYSDKLDDSLLMLSREGLSVGINVIATGAQTNTMGFRVLANYGTRIAFSCNDSAEYSNLFDRCKMRPKDTPGRALYKTDNRILEFQTVFAFDGDIEAERVEAIRRFITLNADQYASYKKARPIPEVPEVLTDAVYIKTQKDLYGTAYQVPLGIDYASVGCRYLDFASVGVFGISGRESSGKTNFISHIIFCIKQQMLSVPYEVYLLDGPEGHLAAARNYGFVKEYSDRPADVGFFIETVYGLMQSRKEQVRLNRAKPADVQLQAMPMVLLLIDSAEAIQELAKDKALQGKAIEMIRRLKRYKVCILLSPLDNGTVNFGSPDIYKAVKDNRQMILLDDIEEIKVFDVSAKQQKMYPKPILPGDAYLFRKGELCKVKTFLSAEG